MSDLESSQSVGKPTRLIIFADEDDGMASAAALNGSDSKEKYDYVKQPVHEDDTGELASAQSESPSQGTSPEPPESPDSCSFSEVTPASDMSTPSVVERKS